MGFHCASTSTLLLALSVVLSVTDLSGQTLENEKIRADFDDQGLISIYDKQLDQTLAFSTDHWSFVIDHHLIDSRHLPAQKHVRDADGLRFFFREGEFRVEVVYQLKPGWRFVTKQLLVTPQKSEVYTVRHMNVFHGRLEKEPRDIFTAGLEDKVKKARGLGDYAAFLRMNDQWGGMIMMQNPFSIWEYEDGEFSLDYRSDIIWRTEYGSFASDRACVGTYALTGKLSPGRMGHRISWLLEPEWSRVEEKIDMGEIAAAIECVRSFLLYRPSKSVRIHIPWCENDYQINVAIENGQAQFKRIVDSASALGIRHMLYTVRNEDIALQEDASDNWNWEHLLWLNQGIRIRKNEWDPRIDELPAKTRELQRYAESKNVKLMAYVYPTLEFEHDEDFLTIRSPNNPQVVATFASRAFQDWFIDTLIAFKNQTGISGYAFDYWSMKVHGASRYAQWFGARRVLETLRRRAPDIVIDGRQQYHGYGPWTWLAGTYPHPTGGDEQPESFEPFPDLHFDRSSGTQQRLTSYWFRNIQFCPPELMPGFIGHQTARKNTAGDVIYNTDFNIRDWDYLGWKFSLFSSIATAPFAHCVDMIPARDKREYELFSQDTEAQAFIRHWFDWTDQNADVLRNLRSIIGPPAMGRVDGTAAMDEDHGFIFLFNPNHRKIAAEFTLDGSLGLTRGEYFTVRQLFPEAGKFIGAPHTGVFRYGDACRIILDGTTALILEVQPARKQNVPQLFNLRGQANLDVDVLRLSGVQGEIGTEAEALVILPHDRRIRRVTVNGRNLDFEKRGRVITVLCRFRGDYFAHNQAVTTYDPSFDGTSVSATFDIPRRIFEQLNNRKSVWSFDWTEEDLECTWLAPERLLLYLQIAQPDWKMNAEMKINGEPVLVKKAYSSRTPGRMRLGKGHNTFTGFYVDVSDLEPDREYSVDVRLPEGLKPGQFQGLFFENVETEYTIELAN